MHFKGSKNAAILILILEGSIFGSLTFVFPSTSILQASAQMMGNGGMMGSGMMGSGRCIVFSVSVVTSPVEFGKVAAPTNS